MFKTITFLKFNLLKTKVELKQYSKKSYGSFLKGLRMVITLGGEDRKIGWGKPHTRIKVDSKGCAVWWFNWYVYYIMVNEGIDEWGNKKKAVWPIMRICHEPMMSNQNPILCTKVFLK